MARVWYCCSGLEHKHEVYSCSQLESGAVKEVEVKRCLPQVVTSKLFAPAPKRPTVVTAKLFTKPTNPEPLRPQAATAKTFVPRTEDMNKGFLMFSDDESGLTSKSL